VIPASGHPAPEVPQRPAAEAEKPAAARLLASRAAQNGWNVEVTFARGTTLAAHGTPGRVVNSCCVRMQRDALRVVGIWHDGKFSTGLMQLDGARGTLKLKARELTALVTAS
jgi:hypothetical protein